MQVIVCSWGLSLFVLFEQVGQHNIKSPRSWGLSLFVLFERLLFIYRQSQSSWGLSLFVLFERTEQTEQISMVLED